MLEIFNDKISDDTLVMLRNQFDNLKNTKEFDDRYFDEDMLQWERICINDVDPILTSKIQKILNEVGANLVHREYIFFVRCYYPASIHVDVTDSSHGNTYIIPLTFNEDIKTVVFKNNTTLAEFNKLIDFYSKVSFIARSKLSETINLDHCWGNKPNIVDVLKLDGYAEWTKGTIIKFARQQIHTSSNFKTLNLEYKDYILCHSP